MDKKSYVVVPEAVDSTDLAAVVDGIWDHMVMDRDDSTTWYEDPHNDGLKKYGFLRQMYSPAM